jgi:hypothetical protein
MRPLSLHRIRAEYPEVFPSILKSMTQPNCSRCGGMMVGEMCMDIESDYAEFQFPARHCLQCGDWIDPYIVFNRFK